MVMALVDCHVKVLSEFNPSLTSRLPENLSSPRPKKSPFCGACGLCSSIANASTVVGSGREVSRIDESEHFLY